MEDLWQPCRPDHAAQVLARRTVVGEGRVGNRGKVSHGKQEEEVMQRKGERGETGPWTGVNRSDMVTMIKVWDCDEQDVEGKEVRAWSHQGKGSPMKHGELCAPRGEFDPYHPSPSHPHLVLEPVRNRKRQGVKLKTEIIRPQPPLTSLEKCDHCDAGFMRWLGPRQFPAQCQGWVLPPTIRCEGSGSSVVLCSNITFRTQGTWGSHYLPSSA
ncbi:hypothetical protein Pcinc_039993 [Petrolisthes cinctipes]|uniref:Uncharacterized protein n=1 Tax=Petrolisthes cinctipes TaxID=88211 RepID=A0AAE1BN30_PETCI|nr:hypothetical protein Pcinc_039993 [Petrolisthes cinctipes]